MKRSFNANSLTDPIGPGSPAWNAYEEAIDAYRAGDKKQGGIRRDFMLRQLRKHGASAEQITSWKEGVKEESKKPAED